MSDTLGIAQTEILLSNFASQRGKISEYEKIYGTPRVPESRYVIFFTARSGSTYLGDLLERHGGLGKPLEWLSPDVGQEIFASRKVFSPDRYIRSIMHTATDPVSGVFGLEATYHQWRIYDLLVEMRWFFPPSQTKFFLLRRADIVAQAISVVKARATGIWHSSGRNFDREKLDAIPYDRVAITSWVEQLLDEEQSLEAVVRGFGVEPIWLTYEVITKANPQAVTDFFCDHLGVEKRTAPLPLETKVGTSNSSQMRARYVRETGTKLADRLLPSDL